LATPGEGGAIENDSSDIRVMNSVFHGVAEWGGIAWMRNDSSCPIITSCTFVGSAEEGQPLFLSQGVSHPVLRNSAVSCGMADPDGICFETVGDEAVHSFQGSLVSGCGGSSDWNEACGADLGGNVDEDPLFADTASGDYSLASASPCIDTGDNSLLPADVADLDGDFGTDEPLPLDLAGNPRVVDGDGDATATVDMGAYEYQP